MIVTTPINLVSVHSALVVVNESDDEGEDGDEQQVRNLTIRGAKLDYTNRNGIHLPSGILGKERQPIIASDWGHDAIGGWFTAGEPPVAAGEGYEDGGYLYANVSYFPDQRSVDSYDRIVHMNEVGYPVEFSMSYRLDQYIYDEEEDTITAINGHFQLTEISPLRQGTAADENTELANSINAHVAKVKQGIQLPVKDETKQNSSLTEAEALTILHKNNFDFRAYALILDMHTEVS